MVAYGEFRTGYNKDEQDTRILVYGLRYILENYVMRPWTADDVEKADVFFNSSSGSVVAGNTAAAADHLAPSHAAFPFPKDLYMKFVVENNGYFPVKIQALQDGTCVNAHVPVYQITAEDEYAPLCTFLETLLTMLWYPTTVATLSRRARDIIEAAFEVSADGGAASPLVASRLHDFGFRGCASLEQSVLGGCAHLVNFDGTDTMSAAYYAQFHLNGGRPVGMSIPATEHSVMTCWPDERAAIYNMIEHFGTGCFATVMDSYDYGAALEQVVPLVAARKVAAGGFWVLRPDSGDPVEVVLQGLRALDRVFGSDTNSKGYKVIRNAGVIQILDAAVAAGFSADNVAFGMGGGLLQRVNRDTMSFATKLNHVVYADGSARDVMKHPLTDMGKISLPGVLAVKRVDGVPTVFPADGGEVAPEEDLLQVVYDKGPLPASQQRFEDFDALRQRAQREWDALPRSADVYSASLQAKIAALSKERTSGKGVQQGPQQPQAQPQAVVSSS
ncbi:Quinolinate phosphoribosyl transferase [Scenedesmus sp. NREL 46B-D3]|nr:Quinolinate phosphoribosyl transferase [Scenedesmus sp. NREL 46B-D3]